MEVDSAGEAKPAAEERAPAGGARPGGTWAEVAARTPPGAAPRDPFVEAMLAPTLTRTANDAATYAVSIPCISGRIDSRHTPYSDARRALEPAQALLPQGERRQTRSM